jgi:hypothetical protein
VQRALSVLALAAVAATAFASRPAGAAAADCVPLRVVFYAANDWLRLAQRLAANSSPCVEYFISDAVSDAVSDTWTCLKGATPSGVGPRLPVCDEIGRV